jgi:hypothetical protein
MDCDGDGYKPGSDISVNQPVWLGSSEMQAIGRKTMVD